jgi:diaminopimelate decarboxylase
MPATKQSKETLMTTVMTQIPDENLLKLADSYYTPLYVFEEAVIRSKCRELKTAITYPRVIIRYACKALTLQAILKIIREEGLWIDASSLNEVLRALRAGFLPQEIYYTGEGATLTVYEELIHRGVLINCTSLDQIRLLGKVQGCTVCSIRINPGEGNGETNKTNTGGPSSKHGIYFDQIDEAKSVAQALGLRIIGVHAHIGSGGHDIEPWLRIKDLTLAIASRFPDLQFVNFGGGLPVVYDQAKQKPMPVKDWGKALSDSMVEFSKIMGREINLQIEPGRYIVAQSGTLLAEVQAVKSTPEYRFVIVNTGLNHNIRPSMYGSFHPIRFARRNPSAGNDKHAYVVAGYLCESGDVFTVKNDGSGILEPREFPELSVGDLMIMGCVGAYSHAMKNEYNSMNLPASILFSSDGSVRVIERRGTLNDIMQRELEAYNEGR